MDIIIDFDGTCVTHEFPNIGKEIGAVPVLQELVKNGHNLILFTMRSDLEQKKIDPFVNPRIINAQGKHLANAVKWFVKNEIPLYGIQTNPTQKSWTSSPKAYGQLIIDDAALGCPLKFDKSFSDRPFVNWESVRALLVSHGLLS